MEGFVVVPVAGELSGFWGEELCMFLCEEFCGPFVCLDGPCGVVEDSASVLDWRFVVWPVVVHDGTFLVSWGCVPRFVERGNTPPGD